MAWILLGAFVALIPSTALAAPSAVLDLVGTAARMPGTVTDRHPEI